VPALLHQAHELRATGVLRLLCGARRKEIALVDGHPAAVRSNLPGERLGEWLLRSGRISRDDCAESIRRMHRGEGLQGEILVAMQALGEEELARALGEHAEEKLLQVFEWSEGSFELVLGAQLEHASALGHGRSPADWIRAGVRTRFPLVRIDAALRTHLGDVAVASANPFYSFQEIALGAEEKVLLREGERGVTVRALLARPAEQRRAAYTLLETGLLELRDGEAMRSGGPAPRVRLHLGAAPGRAAEARRTPAPEDAPAAAPAGTGPRAASGASARAARNAGAPTSTRRPPRAAPAPAAAAATEDDHSHYAADHEQRAALAALLERVRRASPFEKLGLLPDASDAEIRAAYMELAKQTHPDRYAGTSHVVRGLAEQAFREITRAYDLLCDPQQREAYRADPLRDARNTRAAAEGQRALEAEMAFQKGEARLRAYDWAGALAHFERAVELYPGEGEYLAYCGWSYYLAHGHDEEVLRKAFLMVKKGAKLAPDRDKPYLFLGRLCQAGGRLELAEKMFTRAVERRSDCTEALRELRLLAMRKPKQSLVTRLLRRPPGRRAGRGGG
jgi:tetratricopeptide (TPR) repeat protein